MQTLTNRMEKVTLAVREAGTSRHESVIAKQIWFALTH